MNIGVYCTRKVGFQCPSLAGPSEGGDGPRPVPAQAPVRFLCRFAPVRCRNASIAAVPNSDAGSAFERLGLIAELRHRGTLHMLVRREHLGVRSVVSPTHSVADNF